MDFFYFLLALFFALIIITMIATIIKLSLFLITKVKYPTRILLIPSILNLIVWVILFGALYKVLSSILHIDLITLFFNSFVLKTNENSNIIKVIVSLFITFGIGILLQALTYLAINIDYKNIFRSTRWLIKKNIKTDFKNTKVKKLSITNEELTLTFGTAFLASIFAFTIMFFFIIVLFNIGSIISGKFFN